MKKQLPIVILILIAIGFIFTSCQKEVDDDSDVTALKISVQALQARCDSLAQALSANTSSINNLGNSVDSIKIQLNKITSDINTIKSQLVGTNSSIATLLSDIILLNQKFDDLLAKFNYISGTGPFKFNVNMLYTGFDSLSASATVYDTTKWHYVAVTIDASRQTIIYIDGVEKVNYYRPDYPYSYSNVYLGASFYTSFTGFFNGAFDELRISNIVRSQREIQDYYTSCIYFNNSAQNLDSNTIDLWHFDETGGNNFVNSVTGNPSGEITGKASFAAGKSGNALFFDGKTGYGNCGMGVPSSPVTFEFWFKVNRLEAGAMLLQPYGLYSSNIYLTR